MNWKLTAARQYLLTLRLRVHSGQWGWGLSGKGAHCPRAQESGAGLVSVAAPTSASRLASFRGPAWVQYREGAKALVTEQSGLGLVYRHRSWHLLPGLIRVSRAGGGSVWHSYYSWSSIEVVN